MSGTVTQPDAAPQMAAIFSSMKNEVINTWGRVLVSAFVLLLLLIAEVLAYFKPTTVDAGVVDLLKTLSTLVVGYWVGSSASSTTKQGQIATQSAMLAAAPPPPPPGGTTTTVATAAPATTSTNTTASAAPVPPPEHTTTITTTGTATP